MHYHLHILHLSDNTEDEKVNQVSRQRLSNLMEELEKCNITEYKIIDG